MKSGPQNISANILGMYSNTSQLVEDEELFNELEKGGEGSRGGKVIGHTKSGKPVYASKDASFHRYQNFTPEDHFDAAVLHHDSLSRGDGYETDRKKKLKRDSHRVLTEAPNDFIDRHWKEKQSQKSKENL